MIESSAWLACVSSLILPNIAVSISCRLVASPSDHADFSILRSTSKENMVMDGDLLRSAPQARCRPIRRIDMLLSTLLWLSLYYIIYFKR
ncbi:uncharacterized protein F4817DRAFT_229954 [Daldinia loculata]|uniref:uncharacterized protein n=1 Tax=Daldinia loculata TaxID=103429 RepID=UPI0020C2192D|nr:uncharacterized protein F4817DRAFT_229954 [Daldinia loculata]KAI1644052.1 hypothetical protein F4817DRAFT_229954 [Daldinia loculata]